MKLVEENNSKSLYLHNGKSPLFCHRQQPFMIENPMAMGQVNIQKQPCCNTCPLFQYNEYVKEVTIYCGCEPVVISVDTDSKIVSTQQ